MNIFIFRTFFAIFFITIFLQLSSAKNFEIGLESLNCEYNETICSNPLCFVKLVPFRNGLINFGCDLQELTHDLRVSFFR